MAKDFVFDAETIKKVRHGKGTSHGIAIRVEVATNEHRRGTFDLFEEAGGEFTDDANEPPPYLEEMSNRSILPRSAWIAPGMRFKPSPGVLDNRL